MQARLRDDDDLIERVHALATRSGRPVVLFPTADRFVRLLQSRADDLAEVARFHRLRTSKDLVAKSVASDALRQCDLPQAETHILDTAPAPDAIAALPYPCIVKPEFQQDWLGNPEFVAQFGPYRALQLETAAEGRAQLPELARYGRIILQEFIPGPSEALHYFVGYRTTEGRFLTAFVGRKLRTYPDQMGTEVLLESIQDPELVALGERVMTELDLRGPIGIDFKRDPRNGRPKVIEINLRFGSSDGILATAGVDLPWLCHQDLSGESISKPAECRPGVFWHWLERDLDWMRDHRKQYGVSWLAWARHRLTHPYASLVWAKDDPRPALAEGARFLRRVTRTSAS